MTDHILPDGIYFDLDEREYHALHRLSAGGFTNMIEGVSTFWARSWMNPDREEDKETEAQKVGSAYHWARLDPDRFAQLYCCAPDPADFPGALMNDNDVCARLKELGETQRPTIKEEGKPDRKEDMDERAVRLQNVDPDAVIWRLVEADAEAEADGRMMLSPDLWAKIERDARNFTDNPELAELIRGGSAEVSILWTCPESGLSCKCRVDYLKATTWADLKTWNPKGFGVPGAVSIQNKFKYDGHHRSSWHYHEGVEQVRMGNLPVQGEATDDQMVLLREVQSQTKPLEPWYIYQRQGGIPDIRARHVELIHETADGRQFEPSLIARKAIAEVHACKIAFHRCRQIYGTDGAPWFPLDMMGKIADGEFGEHWLQDRREPS